MRRKSQRCKSNAAAHQLKGRSHGGGRYTGMGRGMTREALLREVTRRLVEWYRPVRVYLFGSQARGEGAGDSDFDFLVVVPDTLPRDRWYSREIFALLADIDVPIDVVVWPKSRFEERLRVKASLPATVEREGQLLYAA